MLAISKKYQKMLLIPLLMLGFGLCFFGFLLSLVLLGSRDHLKADSDIMIILGCQVMDWGPSQGLADRLDRALLHLDEFPEMLVIVSGGQGSNEPTTEAKAMSDYLVAAGFPEEQIYQEGNSRNTHQNLSYSLALMEEEGLSGDVVIVSSAFHLFRAKMLWGRVGGDKESLSLLAAEVTDPAFFLHSHLREPLALVKSFLFDQGRVVL